MKEPGKFYFVKAESSDYFIMTNINLIELEVK